MRSLASQRPLSRSGIELINQLLTPGTASTFLTLLRSTRLLSACMNAENAFVSEESTMFCIHPANVSAHWPLCSSTMASSQMRFQNSKSLRCDGLRAAPLRASLSRTSQRFFRAAAPPALLSFAPSMGNENVLIAAPQANLPSSFCRARFAFANAATAVFFSSIAACALCFNAFVCFTMRTLSLNSASSAVRSRLNASATTGDSEEICRCRLFSVAISLNVLHHSELASRFDSFNSSLKRRYLNLVLVHCIRLLSA